MGLDSTARRILYGVIIATPFRVYMLLITALYVLHLLSDRD